MAVTCCEITWLLSLLKDLSMEKLELVTLYWDNQATLYIAQNPIFHECTKHIEFDYYYVRDKIKAYQISPAYVPTEDQVADFFTKIMSTEQYHMLISKLGVVNMFTPLNLRGSDWEGKLVMHLLSWKTEMASWLIYKQQRCYYKGEQEEIKQKDGESWLRGFFLTSLLCLISPPPLPLFFH